VIPLLGNILPLLGACTDPLTNASVCLPVSVEINSCTPRAPGELSFLPAALSFSSNIIPLDHTFLIFEFFNPELEPSSSCLRLLLNANAVEMEI
jgi:hypothetical protein